MVLNELVPLKYSLRLGWQVQMISHLGRVEKCKYLSILGVIA